jgi:hypothetical protein
MYLDSGPGTGKSTLVMELFRRLNVYARRVGYKNITLTTCCASSATTGVAAVVLRHGTMTFDKMHSTMSPGSTKSDKKREQNATLPSLTSISKY